MSSILDFFPLQRIRPSQEKSLLFVEQNILDGYRDIIIQAPTGSGKSAILIAICNWIKSRDDIPGVKGGYYLTAQKLLQTQLENDQPILREGLNNLRSIKSSVEYPCPVHKNCGFGSRAKEKCPCQGIDCAYKAAKGRFLASTIAVTNYAYFFAERRYAGKLEPRQLLALDECHNVERQVIRFVDLTINEAQLEKFAPTIMGQVPPIDTLEELLAWVENVYVKEAISRLEALLELSEHGRDSHEPDGRPRGGDQFARDAFDLDQHICKTNRAIKDAKENPKQWIFWTERDAENKAQFIARPLHSGPFMDEMVDKGGTVRVYTSAYPGEKTIFCRSLGLNPDATPMCRLRSDFDPKNRRVVVFGVGQMGRKFQEETMPLVLKAVDKIVDKHKAERGIIHGHSYDICNKINAHLQNGDHGHRVIFPTKADQREEAFNRHAAMEGSILITPSMTEGFDFKDELARWQIMPKIPWPSLGDRQVKAKADMDPDWYSCETVKAVIQTCGRICRNVNDYGMTYVLDDDFWYLYKKAEHMFPKWFKESIVNAREKK
jgi:ATP-dependent DNA helicase DinG